MGRRGWERGLTGGGGRGRGWHEVIDLAGNGYVCGVGLQDQLQRRSRFLSEVTALKGLLQDFYTRQTHFFSFLSWSIAQKYTN